MVRYSHRHARHLWGLLCPDAELYTEMQPAAALLRANADPHASNRHAVLQLAGDRPAELAAAAELAARLGYAGLNLNCGCPSPRATAGGFGACMMARPDAIESCLRVMHEASGLPVSLKCRLGIDEQDPEQALPAAAAAAAVAGAAGLIIHVRQAWLQGVNPRANRRRPPLQPAWGPRIKRDWPQLRVITNGGIADVAAATERAAGVDGVMLGRAIVSRPQLLVEFATAWFQRPVPSMAAVIEEYLGYCARELAAGAPAGRLLQPLLGLLHGRRGASRSRAELMAAAASADLRRAAAALA